MDCGFKCLYLDNSGECTRGGGECQGYTCLEFQDCESCRKYEDCDYDG